MKNRPFPERLRHATAGIATAWRGESSFRAQTALAAAAAITLAILRPPLVWVALCLVSAAMVLALELVNTALESLADRLHPEIHPAIRAAKDCAAAAVLVAAATAAVIGLLTVAAGLKLI